MTYTPKYCTAQQVYNKTGLSATEIDLTSNVDIIEDAEAELEALAGRKFVSGTTVTEYLNGTKKDILGYSGTQCVSFNLRFYPIQSITEFKFLDIDGSATDTFDTLTSTQVTNGTYYTEDYWLNTGFDSATTSVIPYGKVTMKTDEVPVGNQNIKISYTYGYATVPSVVRALATCLAGMRAWINFLGGNYNRIDSYSIPQQNVTKGDFYARGNQMVESLKAESELILARIGKKSDTLMMAATGDK